MVILGAMDSEVRPERTLFVFTLAGKRVWCSDSNISEEAMSSLTGLCSAVMGVCEQVGEAIRCVSAGSTRLVCLRRGELVLVGMGKMHCEAYLARELEFAYEVVVMALTRGVHKVLASSPGYDMRDLLGSTGTVLSSLETWGRTRPELFLGACRAARLEPATRAQLGHVLLSARKVSEQQVVFGVVLVGDALVSCLAMGSGDRRLKATDVVLLANYVASQRAALVAADASWLPLCLPRFDDRGYLHAHVAFLDPTSDLCLVLVAADDSPETFDTLRHVSQAIHNALDRDGVLPALNDANDETARAAASIAAEARADHFVLARRRPFGASKSSTNHDIAQYVASPSTLSTDLWREYHALALRLRTGSAQPQHTLPHDPVMTNSNLGGATAHDLFEAPVVPNALVYTTVNAITYVALAGATFELYAAFASLAPPADLAKRTHFILRLLKQDEAHAFFDPVLY